MTSMNWKQLTLFAFTIPCSCFPSSPLFSLLEGEGKKKRVCLGTELSIIHEKDVSGPSFFKIFHSFFWLALLRPPLSERTSGDRASSLSFWAAFSFVVFQSICASYSRQWEVQIVSYYDQAMAGTVKRGDANRSLLSLLGAPDHTSF